MPHLPCSMLSFLAFTFNSSSESALVGAGGAVMADV